MWLPCPSSSSLPSLIVSTWVPIAPLPLFLNCGFHHHHLPLVLSQILPCASKLECSLEICLGHSPIPRHLLLPSSECLPYRLASTDSAPGFPCPHGMAPPSAGQTPQLQGATGNPRIPSSELHPSCALPEYQELHVTCVAFHLANHLVLPHAAGPRSLGAGLRR